MRAVQLDQITEIVHAVAPTLENASIRRAGKGECYEAWWVGDDHVFRVPLDKSEGRALEVEMAVLPQLAEKLEVKIPAPEFLWRDETTEYVVLGHRAVHGKPLTSERLAHLSSLRRDALAVVISPFFTQLHDYPLESVDVELPLVANLNGRRENISAIEKLVFPRMTSLDVAACIDMEKYFAPCPPEKWTLLHGDLGPEHIFLDENDEVTGIIDFGNLSRGDPNFDLSAVIYGSGLQFAREVLNHMMLGNAQEELVRVRIRCIWEYLTWSVEELEEEHTNEVDAEIPKIAGLIDAVNLWWR